MIFGIGTDIVEYARIESMWSKYGSRFAERLLSEGELPEFHGHAHPARFLAKRFAAKEAFAKAVGSGLRHPVSLSRISIAHDGLGKPVLMFDAVLRTYLAQAGIIGHHLSISDERNTIVAFVVLETN
ncbi:MAG: holo-ACP synthase [Gallionella sp.]|jgi:holo-[acyl-carrier protein] synthase